MTHDWRSNLLAANYPDPPVYWFPKCTKCGCLVTQCGKVLIYRATSRSEWAYDEPLCPGTHD